MRLRPLLAVIIFITFSCKKSENKPENKRDPEILITELTTSLSSADSISDFTSALKNVNLSNEETAEGITVFAPLDDLDNVSNTFNKFQTSKGSPEATTMETETPAGFSDAVIRDHVVKGVYKLADLTDGKMLTGLNGKQLRISRIGDNLWINNIAIGGKEIVSNTNQVVYVVKVSLENTSAVIARRFTEMEYPIALAEIKTSLSDWHEKLVVLDALISHDVELESIPQSYRNVYRDIDNFRFDASHQAILNVWREGYNTITRVNAVEAKLPELLSDSREKHAQLKAMRAYVYLQLLTYYENIPLKTSNAVPWVESNTNRPAVFRYITEQLQSAARSITENTSDRTLINKTSIKILQAKAALLEKDYQKVLDFTNQVINSNKYALEAPDQIFSTNREMIWEDSAEKSTNIKSYFWNRDKLPYLRLTEVYLMNIEANLALQNPVAAQATYSVLMQRKGIQAPDVNMNILRETWTSEMEREGSLFPNLLRWGTAADMLAPKGFIESKHRRLPIPQAERELNRNLVQNTLY
ncbi:fasciclin domain-containing protein [Desertivirga xinjiangensis]|uniref:fasciclin domain-containing protein n=1 Tax=Desertivirga xinjiangensis TaxID=539206 RepID=UPI0021097922|nr:fasciclin domain-containing protein [Pedobacter xinjiangensis]